MDYHRLQNQALTDDRLLGKWVRTVGIRETARAASVSRGTVHRLLRRGQHSIRPASLSRIRCALAAEAMPVDVMLATVEAIEECRDGR